MYTHLCLLERACVSVSALDWAQFLTAEPPLPGLSPHPGISLRTRSPLPDSAQPVSCWTEFGFSCFCSFCRPTTMIADVFLCTFQSVKPISFPHLVSKNTDFSTAYNIFFRMFSHFQRSVACPELPFNSGSPSNLIIERKALLLVIIAYKPLKTWWKTSEYSCFSPLFCQWRKHNNRDWAKPELSQRPEAGHKRAWSGNELHRGKSSEWLLGAVRPPPGFQRSGTLRLCLLILTRTLCSRGQKALFIPQ